MNEIREVRGQNACHEKGHEYVWENLVGLAVISGWMQKHNTPPRHNILWYKVALYLSCWQQKREREGREIYCRWVEKFVWKKVEMLNCVESQRIK